jgi:hypothetical protein
LKERLLFAVGLLWGPKDKEQSQVRKPRNTLQQSVGGQWPLQIVVEKGKAKHRPTEKVRLWSVQRSVAPPFSARC